MEYGIIMPKGINHIRRKLTFIIDDKTNELTSISRQLFIDLLEQFKQLDERIHSYDKKIESIAKENKQCQRLLAMRGIGPITATALVALLGDVNEFSSGRQFSAYLGLVPRQHSSGNKTVLLGISKRGDKYLRELLVHGGRSVVRTAHRYKDRLSQWVLDKKHRGGENIAAVAMANKNARIAWALLSKECDYQSY